MKNKSELELEKVSSSASGKMPKDQVSVNKNSITIPAWCKDEFGGKEEGSADASVDRENEVIAIEPADDGQFPTKYNRVNCGKILKSFDIDHEDEKRYEAEFDDGQLLIDLSEPKQNAR